MAHLIVETYKQDVIDGVDEWHQSIKRNVREEQPLNLYVVAIGQENAYMSYAAQWGTKRYTERRAEIEADVRKAAARRNDRLMGVRYVWANSREDVRKAYPDCIDC